MYYETDTYVDVIFCCRHSRHASGGDVIPILTKTGMSRSSSGNSVNSSNDYTVPRCQSFTQAERDLTPTSSEDSGSSCSGSMHRKQGGSKGPMRGIHGLTMSKHSSQDSIDQHRNSMDNVAQYATLRRSNSRKQSSQSLEFQPHGPVPSSPANKCSPGPNSPSLGSLPSPFACFRSPYAQIQSGEIQNQLHKDKRSTSVPSSPVAKSAQVGQANNNSDVAKKPPAPPKRTLSMKRNSGEPESPEDEDEIHEFPPPPPPIAFSLEAMKTHQPKTNGRLDYRSSERGQSPLKNGLKLQNVSDSCLAARRRAGSAEKEACANKNNNNTALDQDVITPTDQNQNDITARLSGRSNSATPRNSMENIPFANDNAGTIKHKSGQSKPSLADMYPHESGLDNAIESEDNEEGDFDTVKRMPKSGECLSRVHCPPRTCMFSL